LSGVCGLSGVYLGWGGSNDIIAFEVVFGFWSGFGFGYLGCCWLLVVVLCGQMSGRTSQKINSARSTKLNYNFKVGDSTNTVPFVGIPNIKIVTHITTALASTGVNQEKTELTVASLVSKPKADPTDCGCNH
jgi:hypothetical protein